MITQRALRHSGVGVVAFCLLLATLILVVATPSFSASEDASWEVHASASVKAYEQKDFSEAQEQLDRALRAAEKLGPQDTRLPRALGTLGFINEMQGRVGEAASLYRRVLKSAEEGIGSDHPDLDISLVGMGRIYSAQGDFSSAAVMYERALRIQEKTRRPDDRAVATSLNNLAEAYRQQGEFAKAEPLYLRALSTLERLLGPEDPKVATSLSTLATLYLDAGRYENAEPLMWRALRIREKALPHDHADIAMSLNSLGVLYEKTGRYSQAESFHLRSLAIWEKTLGSQHRHFAVSLNNLAMLYNREEQYAKAEPLLRRAVAVWEGTLGPSHPDVGRALSNLAGLLERQAQYAEAESLQRRALIILHGSVGPQHPDVGLGLANLGAIAFAVGKRAEAAGLYVQAVRIFAATVGLDHPYVGGALFTLGEIYRLDGHYGQAVDLHRRALEIREKTLGSRHRDIGQSLTYLSASVAARGELRQARELLKRAQQIRVDMYWTSRELDDDTRRSLIYSEANGILGYLGVLADLIRDRLSGADRESAIADAFKAAEDLRATAAQSALMRAGARAAAGDQTVGALVRKAQEMGYQRQATAKRLAEEYSKPLSAQTPGRAARLRGELGELERQAAEIAGDVRKRVPSYAELISAEPVSLEEVRDRLRPGEALVSYASLEDRLLIWLVTPGRQPVYKDISVPKTEVLEVLRQLRSSIDQSQNRMLSAGRLNPVDLAGAYRLYTLLVEPLRADLRGVQRLFLVPDEALLPVPFAALVTDTGGEVYRRLEALYRGEQPAEGDALGEYANVAWLTRDYAIALLPSASSIRALRGARKPTPTELGGYVGVGDPALGGVAPSRDGTMLRGRGVGIDLADLRRLGDLPGTRQELETLARALGADPTQTVYVRERATKRMVTELNLSGRFQNAEVVAFATHALIAGEVRGLKEPALVLTPPAAVSEEDDGLLGLAEIVDLRLRGNAWVVLSACNTAAPDGSGEGLSGLVRAFFFAGARSLLVSQWEVDDRATQELITKIFRRYAIDRGGSRSEAVRQGMLTLMSSSSNNPSYFAHPFAWAPFVLVGDGGGD